MKQKNIKYNIGLDIGTNSVGWVVTDLENNILKLRNKNMWGARLFEEGQPAAKTRSFRCSKRRLDRRKQRINILQSLLLNDIEIEYPNFIKLLKESSLDKTDKQFSESINERKYNLFSDIRMTDRKYYQKYPTIYHLRNELINNSKKQDIRLVYLAIHHIIKYRGNFLYEGEMKTSKSEIINEIETIISYLTEEQEIGFNCECKQIEEVLKDKTTTKAEKKDKIISMFEYDKDEKPILTGIVSAILGYKFDINKIFSTEIENSKISFMNEIENENEIEEELQENSYIFDSLLKIYNWFILQDILQDILQGKTYISEAFIEKYNKYKKDLNILKKVYRENLKEEYNNMFRKKGKDNYVAYNGKEVKKCTLEELQNKIKKDLAEVKECKEKEYILKEIENQNLLVKINSTVNAAIPYQQHYNELEKILENQSKYYPTINENKEHILQLMTFRIPYYVGPLDKNGQSRFSWVIRKSNDKVLPWSFEKTINIDETAEAFIKRMTNKCTYLINEDVIPKQSILYSKFCVLNELSNIKINNHKITGKLKQEIIEKLFSKNKTVKENDLKKMLLDNQYFIKIDSITGFTEGNKFMSNMSSYIDMSKIFGNITETNIEMIENIIEWITIFEDKRILKRRIKEKYNLSQETINQILKLNYSGWSRLSKKLLNEIRSKDDGKTILEKLETSKENFMQIINNKNYGFDEEISRLIKQDDEKITYKNVEEIPTSPANKRSIWQTIKIVKEITQIMKKEPENIYIEFARNEEQKNKKKKNRSKAILEIYDKFMDEIKQLREYNPQVYKELKEKQNEKDFNERLYLYFVQNGRCMYTSKPLNIDTLYLYEVDHIIPQSYVKDDSLSNKVLVYKEENQRKSGNLLLNENIINKQEQWWKQLHKTGLIDDKKLYNLTRRKMFETDSDKIKFISRQLVETRQVTKYVTNLLVNEYKNSNVFAIRAELTHNFREFFKLYKNRNINNYHHAQDAYIISIIGNIIDRKMYYKDEYKYTQYIRSYIKKNEEDNNKKIWIIMGMIANNIDKERMVKTFYYKDCFITRKLEEQTGEFYKQRLYGPKDERVKAIIPLKNDRPVTKYGGYSGENKAYFSIYSYIDAKYKIQIGLSGIPIKVSYDIKNKKITLENYITSTLSNKQIKYFKILKPKILKYQEYIDEENRKMALLSDSEIRVSKELIVSPNIQSIIYVMNKQKQSEEETAEVEKNIQLVYDYLLNKIKEEYIIFEPIYQKLNSNENKNKFMKLEYKDKICTINGLIDLMEKGQGDLSKLGFSDRSGRKSSKTFTSGQLRNMKFIDTSITGMYERRYKVDGVEDNCNK